MRSARSILVALGKDETAMRAFVADTEAWVHAHAEDLGADDLSELRRVGQDARTFLEARCLEHYGDKGEQRFAKSAGMPRRHLLFKAASVVFAAGILASGGGRFVRSAQAATGESQDLAAADNACMNDFFCSDEDGCVDNLCENNSPFGCSDHNNCRDIQCRNSISCDDTMECKDEGCQNDRDCSDSECIDFSQCTNGGNNNCSDSSTCTDAGCANTQNCTNSPGCVDMEPCTNSLGC